MLLKSINRKSFALAVVTALAVASLQTAPAYADGPFEHFAGHWRGSGKISMADGTQESISCRGAYSVGDAGATLIQNLTCASASYKVEVSSQVQAQGGQLSGSWTETTRSVTGSVSGTVSGSTIRAIVTGATFTAGLSLVVNGSSQFVSIKPEGVTDIVSVTVSLKRS
jgi:hypothetical protein